MSMMEEDQDGEQLEWERRKSRKKDKERKRIAKGKENTFGGSSRDIRSRKKEDNIVGQGPSKAKRMMYADLRIILAILVS